MTSSINNLKNGGEFKGDRHLLSWDNLPPLINRLNRNPLIFIDAAGFVITINGEKNHRLIFSEDKCYPDNFSKEKVSINEIIRSSMNFDNSLSDAYRDGIPEIDKIFIPNFKISISDNDAIKLIAYYDKADVNKDLIEETLRKANIFRIPTSTIFNQKYQESKSNINEKLGMTIVSDGWCGGGDVLKRQVVV